MQSSNNWALVFDVGTASKKKKMESQLVLVIPEVLFT